MASAMNKLGVAATRGTFRVRPRRARMLPWPQPVTHFRGLKTHAPKPPESILETLNAEGQAVYDSLSPEERKEFEAQAGQFDEYMNSPRVQAEINAEMSKILYQLDRELPRESAPYVSPGRPGLLALGEPDEREIGADPTFMGDDMTSTGHADLEQHRELREYARIAAWEMPMLSKLAKPFEPPSLDRPLRFRYTDYMGEKHPAARKIVVEFCTADLPLTPKQRLKLVKLVGPRYNPQKDIVKMSCEMFETQAQNKRYLGDLVDTLMKEAQNESLEPGGKDSFDDVPVDFRHVKWKRRLAFPEAWKLTPERKEQLAAEREHKDRLGWEQRAGGLLVDGVGLVAEALKRSSTSNADPALLEAKVPRRSKAPARRS